MQQEKIIKRILDDLNAGRSSVFLINRPLSANVEIAKIWIENPTPEKSVSPFTAYLIKSGEKYVGGVLDSEDLYAYVLSSMRKKGLMSTALRNIILPHLLQQRALIRVNLNKAYLGERNYSSAKRLALAVGFELFRDQGSSCRLMIDASRLKQRELIKGSNIPFSDNDLDRLRKHLLYAASHLEMVRTELEFRQGISGASEDLRELLETLLAQAEKLPGVWFQNQDKN